MSFSSKKAEQKLLLVLDIQSSAVRSSLNLCLTGQKPHILFTYNADLLFKAETDSKSLISMTLKAIDDNIEAVKQYMNIRANSKVSKIPGKITAVHYVLSSPWIVSQAKKLSLSFEKSTKITAEYIRSLIEKERSKLIKTPSEPVKIIEEKIFDVRLNGYSVSEWEGKETRKLDISFTVSLAGKGMIEFFTEKCAHFVHNHNIFFHSSLLLQHIAVDRAGQGGECYALVHVHGEITDVSITKNEDCIFFGTLTFGISTFVRKIAAATGNDLKAADSLLELYTGKGLDETHGKGAIATIDTISGEWIAELGKSLSEAGVDMAPPLSIILSAKAYDNCFTKALEKRYPKVKTTVLSLDDLLPIVTFDREVDRRRLTALYAIALNFIS